MNTINKLNVLPEQEEPEEVEKEMLRMFKHFIWRPNRIKKSLVPNYIPPETITKAA